ncbi:protein POLAR LOCALIZATION DURING ASYMMETRIC DIVISION AND REDISTRIBUTION-like isoform X2 [Prosopis cineraria]|uniref:protein POLAR LOCALIZATION DURING ASYMMETRIC DIVISION AND REDISTRIBUTION-like isoform X2 n=1 Tax=Prosopis cineraria TaxID=364024 RepID=UPI00240FBA66|nr:protein POLAR LOCALIZATION DURING ASYMMETRIC DIVISION AND REDISTRIBUTION-like isoform X2 [Prosopis cineraria]
MRTVFTGLIHMSECVYKSVNLSPSNHSNHRRLRVADILLDRADDARSCGCDRTGQTSMDGAGERLQKKHDSAPIHYYSPCRIVDRLLAMLRRGKKPRVSQQRQKMHTERREFKRKSLSESRSMNGLNGNEESGQHRNDTSFKLGVTWGLLYMIAASKHEFSRMVELRKEMEMLLRRTEEELPRRETIFKPFKPTDALSCSITDMRDVSSSNSHIFVPSRSGPEKNTAHNHVQECKLSKQDEYVEGIHGLEAELKVELERLELYLDEETAFEDTQEERVKVEHMDLSTRSNCTSYGEIIEAQEASTDVSFGVHPIELERRLHELLEARLQEQITDLEYALECTRQKVIEKETEVTWWKDTVRLISQHVPEASRFTFRLDPKAALKLKAEF